MSHLKAILSCLGISTDSPVISMADVKSFCPKEFLGDDYMKSNIKYAEICQWLSFSESFNGAEDLSFLNTVFWSQSFLVGNRATLADIALYVTLHTAGGFTSFSSICRWFDHIQSLFGVSSGLSLVLIPKHPTLFPCKTIGQSTSPAQASTTAVTAATAVKAPEKVSATANVSSVALNPSTEIKVPKDPNTSKEKPVKPAASKETLPPLADGDDLNPTLLDIRVGKVVKCWDHPESEKLLCEEIDLGEGSHRMIASGLRAFYKSSDLEGRNVMVLSNLKERPMAGFKSQVNSIFDLKNPR